MTLPDENHIEGVSSLLDDLAADEATQSNCMFQLAIMMAKIAIEPCAEAYKDDAVQRLLSLIRNKPKSNVVRLFGAMQARENLASLSFATA